MGLTKLENIISKKKKKKTPSLIIRASRTQNTSKRYCYHFKISAPPAKNGRLVFYSLLKVFVLKIHKNKTQSPNQSNKSPNQPTNQLQSPDSISFL